MTTQISPDNEDLTSRCSNRGRRVRRTIAYSKAIWLRCNRVFIAQPELSSRFAKKLAKRANPEREIFTLTDRADISKLLDSSQTKSPEVGVLCCDLVTQLAGDDNLMRQLTLQCKNRIWLLLPDDETQWPNLRTSLHRSGIYEIIGCEVARRGVLHPTDRSIILQSDGQHEVTNSTTVMRETQGTARIWCASRWPVVAPNDDAPSVDTVNAEVLSLDRLQP